MVERFPPDPNPTLPPPPSTVSIPGDGKFGIYGGNRSPEQAAVIAATNGNAAHLHVYLIGGHSGKGMRIIEAASLEQSDGPAVVVAGPLKGYADEGNAPVCWVDAERSEGGEDASVEGVLWTIAHEVGHHFVGLGHPDELTGVAPLEGSDLGNRLMLSGTSSLRKNPRGIQLVKREWDEADIRVEEIGESRIPPN